MISGHIISITNKKTHPVPTFFFGFGIRLRGIYCVFRSPSPPLTLQDFIFPSPFLIFSKYPNIWAQQCSIVKQKVTDYFHKTIARIIVSLWNQWFCVNRIKILIITEKCLFGNSMHFEWNWRKWWFKNLKKKKMSDLKNDLCQKK